MEPGTKGVSNLAGRPHALTIWNTHNSTFTGIRFVQSQMWYGWMAYDLTNAKLDIFRTMTLSASSHVHMRDIFVSSTSNDSVSSNTLRVLYVGVTTQ
jgi:galacturan 1,4-alpha-galacturonidase